MGRCEHCGRWVADSDDMYTYKNRALCEDCAGMLQERDFNRPSVMGCDGPVWKLLAEDKSEKSKD